MSAREFNANSVNTMSFGQPVAYRSKDAFVTPFSLPLIQNSSSFPCLAHS